MKDILLRGSFFLIFFFGYFILNKMASNQINIYHEWAIVLAICAWASTLKWNIDVFVYSLSSRLTPLFAIGWMLGGIKSQNKVIIVISAVTLILSLLMTIKKEKNQFKPTTLTFFGFNFKGGSNE